MQLTMYAYFTEMLLREGADAAVKFAKKCGFDSVELLELIGPGSLPIFPNEDSVKQLREILDMHGMRCACYSVGISLLADNVGPTKNQSSPDALKACAVRASILGSPYLHHTLMPERISNLPPPLAINRFLPLLIERAQSVADHCASLGVTTLYEPQGYYINGADSFGRFYESIKAKGHLVGVCGDVGNCLYADQSPTLFFKRYAGEMRHVHLKDLYIEDFRCNRQSKPFAIWDQTANGSALTEVPLGMGVVDLNSCMQELQRAEYQGSFALETFYWDENKRSLALHLERDRDYIVEKYGKTLK